MATKSCWFLITSIFIIGFAVNSTLAETKIAPAEGEPSHPFTIIDTPEGRLFDGSVAVFKLFGTETVLPLRTHRPHKTAQGRLNPDMQGGDYLVFVRQPDGTEFEIGNFAVLAPVAPSPSIFPDLGARGDAFTITDPLAQMRSGDVAVFYAEGTDPAAGFLAENITVTPDGTILTGNVPADATQGVQNYVSVRPSLSEPPIFGDLAFFVIVTKPFIEPTAAWPPDPFTITDPQGRMESGDIAVFYVSGSDPATGSPATDIVVSSDGTTLTGNVPGGLSPGQYYVSVRATLDSLSRFGDIVFYSFLP